MQDVQLRQRFAGEEEYIFANNLLKAMSGVSIDQLPEEKMYVVEDALGVFYRFIEQYFKDNFGIKAAMKLKATQKYGVPEIQNDEELSQQFDEAYQNFTSQLA